MGLLDWLFRRTDAPVTQRSYPEFDALIEQSMAELRLKTQAHDAMFQISQAVWNVNLDDGVLTFDSGNGVKAVCDIQVVGTRNVTDASFLWGWDHPSVSSDLQAHAIVVREYGEANGYSWLTSPMLKLPEEKAWELAALACKLNEAQGAFRGRSGDTSIFMTFQTVSLSKST